MEERFLLEGGAPWLTQLWFLNNPRPPSVAWALPHQSLAEKMSRGLAYRTFLGSHFLNYSFLFPDDSNCVKLTKKKKKNQTSTTLK